MRASGIHRSNEQKPNVFYHKTETLSDEVQIGFTVGAWRERTSLGSTFKRIGPGFRAGSNVRGVRISSGLPV